MEALRILLIEPDRHARDLLRLLVEAAYTGVIVTTARTAADGMELLQQQTRYDIAVCDESPLVDTLRKHCDEAGCTLVLMVQDSRLKPSDLKALHPNLPVRSLLYKPIMFREFCQNLHKAVLMAWSREQKTSRRRSAKLIHLRRM